MKKLSYLLLFLFSIFSLSASPAAAISSSEQWFQLEKASTSVIYYDVDEGRDMLVAVGLNGELTYSMDDGDTWTDVNETSNTLYAVTESNFGIVAAGENGTVITAEDDESWDVQTIGSGTLDIMDVDCSGDYCVLVTDSGYYYYSRDAGESWSTVISPPSSSNYQGVHVGASGTFWVSGANGELKQSSAATITSFTEQTSGSSEVLLDIHFLSDEQTGWAVGGNGTIVSTTDGGDTWTDASIGSTNWYHVVSNPSDEDHLFILGESDIMESTDGGSSWDSVTLSSSMASGLFSGSVINGSLVAAGVSSSGGVIITDDTTAPSAPTNLSTSPSSPSANQTPTLSWTDSTDDKSGIEGYYIYLDGSMIDGVENGSGDESYTFSTLSEGEHTLGVIAADYGENESSMATVTYRVDKTGPTIGSLSSTTVAPGESTITSTVTDDYGTVDECNAHVDGATSQEYLFERDTLHITFTLEEIGEFNVNMDCTDSFGNNSSTSEMITISEETSTESESSESSESSSSSESTESGSSGSSSESSESSSSSSSESSSGGTSSPTESSAPAVDDSSSAVSSLSELSTGSLIKFACEEGALVNDPCTAVYYYGADEKRHAFPNSKVYFTWYEDFDDVIVVTQDVISDITLGSNVTYRPGVRMVKFLSWNTVYTVSAGGELRAVPSEEVAIALYGDDWNQQIDDISDAFFSNYSFGDDLADENDYDADDAYGEVDDIDDDIEAKS